MGDSKERETLPRLLELISDGKEWKARREAQDAGRSRNTDFGSEEDRKLELKLGLPGIIEETAEVPRHEGIQRESPVLSLGCFREPSKPTTNTTTTGTKRVFLDTIDAKTEGCDEQKQQVRAGCGNELALEQKIVAVSERKKGCCPQPSHAPPAAPVRNRPKAQGRGASAPVVGWPPIGSFRRNLANGSSSKQSTGPQKGEAEKLSRVKNRLVKINMDGIPIGRKVNLAAYDSYERLSLAVKELFHGFLQGIKPIISSDETSTLIHFRGVYLCTFSAPGFTFLSFNTAFNYVAVQKDLSSAENAQLGADEKIFSQLLNGSGEYTLVYEDNEGDKMLVGDVPWNVFVSTAKRLRVLRSSELSHGLIGVAPRRVPNC